MAKLRTMALARRAALVAAFAPSLSVAAAAASGSVRRGSDVDEVDEDVRRPVEGAEEGTGVRRNLRRMRGSRRHLDAPSSVADDADAVAADDAAPEPVDVKRLRAPRIIGGSGAKKGDWDFIVSMRDDWGHFCGGTLVAANVFVTAAHCLGGPYDVMAGSHSLNGGGQKIKMKKEIEHPGYNDNNSKNDIAVVVLSDSFELGPGNGVETVGVNEDKSFPPVGTTASVAGWGETKADNRGIASNLLYVDVDVISNAECGNSKGTIGGWSESYKNSIFEDMICAKEDGKDACQGDSGGPLVAEEGGEVRLVGVVSWGIGCASRYFPGVYSRTSHNYKWVKDLVCEHGDEPDPSFGCGGSSQGGGDSSGDDSGGVIDLPGGGGGGGGGSSGKWTTVLAEDFNKDMGEFEDGGTHAGWRWENQGAQGVLKLQSGGASAVATTDSISVSQYDTCKAEMTYLFLGFEHQENDKWMAEASTNGGKSFQTLRTYSPDSNSDNKVWKTETVTVSVKGSSTLKFRLACDSNSKHDDVMFDEVKISCQ